MNGLRTAHGLWLAAILVCISMSPGWASFTLVEDFEGLNLGPVDDQGLWTAEDTTSVVALDPALLTNQVLAVTTESTHLYRDMMIEDGTVRMMFMRFRFAEQLNGSWGLSDHVHPYRFDHFDVELGLDNADGDLRINDGGRFDVLTTLQPNRWYNCWVLVDNESNQTQVWLHARMGDAANSGDQLSAGDQTVFLFRSLMAGDLVTFYIKTGGGNGLTGPLYIDDIYLEDTGELNLENPSPSAPAGLAGIDAGGNIRSRVSPNPFSGQIEIDLTIPQSADLDLAVFDGSGRRLTTLGVDPIGRLDRHSVWNGRDASGRKVAAGVYYLRFKIGGTIHSHRIVRVD